MKLCIKKEKREGVRNIGTGDDAIKPLRVAVAFRGVTSVRRAIKKSSRPMPSSRHAGHPRWGAVRVYIYERIMSRACLLFLSFSFSLPLVGDNLRPLAPAERASRT